MCYLYCGVVHCFLYVLYKFMAVINTRKRVSEKAIVAFTNSMVMMVNSPIRSGKSVVQLLKNEKLYYYNNHV